MRSLSAIINLLFLTILFCGCSKEESKVKEGTYKGTFTVTYSTGSFSGETTLEIKNGKYICSRNQNNIPAGGSGTCSFANNKAIFNEENLIWTTDFEAFLRMDGEYGYSISGKKLKIYAERSGVGYYEYVLKRQ